MRSFFIIWLGQAFSRLGSQIVQFALIWYLTETTGSATVLAGASIVGLLPQITLGPLAGTLVDRCDRRKVLIYADSMIAVVTILLAFLFALGMVQIWHIYILMFIRALGGAFHTPAMTASTTLLVPERHLARIQGLNGTLGARFGAFRFGPSSLRCASRRTDSHLSRRQRVNETIVLSFDFLSFIRKTWAIACSKKLP